MIDVYHPHSPPPGRQCHKELRQACRAGTRCQFEHIRACSSTSSLDEIHLSPCEGRKSDTATMTYRPGKYARAKVTFFVPAMSPKLCQMTYIGVFDASINTSKTLLVTHGYSQKCHVILTPFSRLTTRGHRGL